MRTMGNSKTHTGTLQGMHPRTLSVVGFNLNNALNAHARMPQDQFDHILKVHDPPCFPSLHLSVPGSTPHQAPRHMRPRPG